MRNTGQTHSHQIPVTAYNLLSSCKRIWSQTL